MWKPALLIRSMAVVVVLLSARSLQAQCVGVATTQIPGTRTLNSAVVSGSNTTYLYVGIPLQGAGIPTGAVVATINGPTSFTMSAEATPRLRRRYPGATLCEGVNVHKLM